MAFKTSPNAQSAGLVAFQVKVNGSEVRGPMRENLESIEFESTYTRPDVCTIAFTAPEVSAEKPLPTFEMGAAIEVAVGRSSGSPSTIFRGKLSSYELESRYGFTRVVLQAYDVRQKLYRGTKTRTFENVAPADVVRKILGENGLSGSVGAVATTSKFESQHQLTDGDYLEQLFAQWGYVSTRAAASDRLEIKLLHEFTTEVGTLTFGETLESYHVRRTSDGWLEEVEMRTWDAAQKKEVLSSATSPRTVLSPEDKTHGRGLGGGKASLVGRFPDQASAEKAAQARLERALSASRALEGTTDGNEKFVVGGVVKVTGIDATHDGDYRLSTVRHLWDAEGGFRTEFACNGAGEQTVLTALSQAGAAPRADQLGGHIDGVVTAIVTDTKDPEDLGRVKVSFPWLPPTSGGSAVAHWVRLVVPGGGQSQKGLYLVPEVNDEVLVAFDGGDLRRGFLVGGLYNTKDKPPLPNGEAVKAGKTPQKAFRSSKGHLLTFNDSENKPGVKLETASKDITVDLDDRKGAVTLTAKKSGATVTITSDGDVTIKSEQGGVTIQAMKDITMKATGNIKLEATQNVTIKATANASVEGTAGAAIKGAKVDVQGQAMTNISGGMVKIN